MVVVTDPFPPDLGYKLGQNVADVVTVSHSHPSHSFVQGIEGARVIHGPGEYEIHGVLIIGIPAYHDTDRGKTRGKNTVYLMEIDGVTVCHVGDLGHTFNSDQLEEIGGVDVLLLPVGGLSTIDASVAAEVVRQLEPKVVIPMHYQTPELKRELDPVDKFLKVMGSGPIEARPKINVTKSNLPLTTQIFLLNV